jgi:hypothetical protein
VFALDRRPPCFFVLLLTDPRPASASDGPLPMTDDNNTAIDAIQIDDDILYYTVSDEALEAAAGIESQNSTVIGSGIAGVPCCPGTS